MNIISELRDRMTALTEGKKGLWFLDPSHQGIEVSFKKLSDDELKAGYNAIIKNRAYIGGHNRRARIDAHLDDIKAELVKRGVDVSDL